MAIYFESLQTFQANGGLKQSTITAKQLLPALVTHMQRGDRKFSLHINGRLPKPLSELLQDAFDISHLQQPFHTQHCARQQSKYINVSKSRIKIDFSMHYRMSRDEHKWVVDEIGRILKQLIKADMSDVQKVVAVHDYIVRNHQYEMNTTGSPFTVFTFMHEKQGVCMAYALLFEKMMEELHIPCYYVVGKADGESDLGHAWNMVQLGGEWYHIDATWNDLGSKLKNHEIRYRYFLRSDEFMKRDHHWNHNHYPQCLSETYKGMSNFYDVTYCEDAIYFPHPTSAKLIKMNVDTRKTVVLVEGRVQFCSEFEKAIYFCSVDNERHLYKLNTTTNEVSCVEKREVIAIKRTLSQLIVTFREGDPLCLEAALQEITETVEAYDVELAGFGNSWFGTYKGKAQAIRFTDGAGLELLIQDSYKQVAVDILCHDKLQISLTANKKPLKATKPVVVTLPKELAERVGQERVEIMGDCELELEG